MRAPALIFLFIMASYPNISEAVFESRPNRFIAYVRLDGERVKCHVKNTGRCRELLVPGCRAFVCRSDNPNRSTAYDLVAVMKGDRLINMDSQIPNEVAAEGLRSIPEFGDVTEIRREYTYGDSRVDIMAEAPGHRYLVEVKGVTLERDGVVLFPDAPTERGTKHLHNLIRSIGDGWEPYVLFVIQMDDVRYFTPNAETDPVFAEALIEARDAGVGILAYTCDVRPDSMVLKSAVCTVLSADIR